MVPFTYKQVNNNRLECNAFSYMKELFESMEGTWKLYRTLNQSGLMYGKGTFTKIGNGLLYRLQTTIVYLYSWFLCTNRN